MKDSKQILKEENKITLLTIKPFLNIFVDIFSNLVIHNGFLNMHHDCYMTFFVYFNNNLNSVQLLPFTIFSTILDFKKWYIFVYFRILTLILGIQRNFRPIKV